MLRFLLVNFVTFFAALGYGSFFHPEMKTDSLINLIVLILALVSWVPSLLGLITSAMYPWGTDDEYYSVKYGGYNGIKVFGASRGDSLTSVCLVWE